jgi:hypothetical protein
MTLTTKIIDPTLTLQDAIAYEFFMDNLPNIIGDSLGNPNATEEEINEIVDGISLLALLSYRIAQRFEVVRNTTKKTEEEN